MNLSCVICVTCELVICELVICVICVTCELVICELVICVICVTCELVICVICVTCELVICITCELMLVFFFNLVPGLNDKKRIEVRIPLYIMVHSGHVTVMWLSHVTVT